MTSGSGRTVGRKAPPGSFRVNTAEEKRAGREKVLAGRPHGEPFRVFAFGSLMWNPECAALEVYAGRLRDYRRRFHIWTTRARGTPDNPGLGLCIEYEEGASVRGLVLELCEDNLDRDLEALWDREQHTGVYLARWVDVEVENGRTDGRTVRSLTFVVNRDHELYAGPLPLDEMAACMAVATGRYGGNQEYLENLLIELEKLGVTDSNLEELMRRIKALD